MNEYLARLKAKIQEKPIPQELTKLTKGGFGFAGSLGAPFQYQVDVCGLEMRKL
jgi:hypothetical protein